MREKNEELKEIEQSRRQAYEERIKTLKSRQSFLNSFFRWATILIVVVSLINIGSSLHVTQIFQYLHQEEVKNYSLDDLGDLYRKGQINNEE